MGPVIATEWRGCTPGAVSGIECTMSPCTVSGIVNTAGEKSPTGGGMSGENVMSGEI